MKLGKPPQGNIKGVWQGTYVSWRTGEQVPFTLTITTVDPNEKTFRGFITETSDLPRSTVYGVYSFEGYCIAFTKTYNTLGYSIEYEGRLLPGKANGIYKVGPIREDWTMEKTG